MQNEYNYDADDSVRLQEEALTIIAFIETITNLVNDYGAFVETLNKENKAEAEVYLAKLKALQAALCDSDTNLSKALNENQDFSSKYPSKIKRLGIAGDMVKLVKDKGYSYEAVARQYGVSRESVSKFFQVYDASAPAARDKITKNNVYDIEKNMQNIHAMLLRQLARFEADGDISVKFIGEYTKLLSMAERQQKEWARMRQMDQVIVVVHSVLSKYCNKEARLKVAEEFKQLGMSNLSLATTEPKVIVDITSQ
jgi:transposase-like protein